MKKLVFIGLAIMLLAALILTGCGDEKGTGKKVVLRENLIHPATDYMAKYTQTMANRFNAMFEGEYEITVHPGGALLGMAESLDGVRTGAVEIGQYPPGVFSNTDVRFSSCEMPFLYNNVEANIAACDELLPVYSEFMEEKYNQKALALWTATSLDLLSTKPIRTLEDWEGLQVMAINPPCAAVITAFGGAAVSIDFPDAYTSLDKGTVEAGMYATTQMIEYSMWEVADYCVPVYMVPTFIVAAINLDTWNDLPKDVQDALLEEHQQMAHDLNALYEVLVTTNPDTLASHGVDIYILPEAERERWREAIQPWVDEQMEAMGDFAERIQEIADEINAKYPYIGYLD
ncbi:MAG: TRAP transporter substrate-binding protein DctP [Dehalococcoidia bacterium]|jgi:TRAP-type C4-dicarboxylate transport system substrate-binding protein